MRSFPQFLLAFTAILGVCIAGALHLTWWAAVAGGCVLMLLSLINQPRTAGSLGRTGVAGPVLYLSSITNASLASSGALVIGRAIGLASGLWL